VNLSVYDVLGNEIAALINEELQPGEYEVEFSRNLINQVLSSGVYIYQLKIRNSEQLMIKAKKMLLLR
jgi:hypothetical protein